MTNLYIYTLAGLIGLVIGSFLNVVISRLPVIVNTGNNEEQDDNDTPAVRFNLWMPRSRCDSCLTPIRLSRPHTRAELGTTKGQMSQLFGSNFVAISDCGDAWVFVCNLAGRTLRR